MGKLGRLLLLGLGQIMTVSAGVLAGQFTALEGGALAGLSGAVLAVLLIAGAAALLLVPILLRLPGLENRQKALRLGSMFLVLVSLPFLFLENSWHLWWGLLCLGLAWTLPLRAALVRAAAADLQVSATRLLTVGIFYSLAAAFAAWVLGFALWRLEGPGIPLPFGYALACLIIGLATSLVPPFSEEVSPSKQATPFPGRSPLAALLDVPAVRWALPVGGLVRGGLIALVVWLLLMPPPGAVALGGLQAVSLLLFGMALAVLITLLQPHPRRILGFLPPGLTALAVILFLMAWSDDPVSYLPAVGWAIGFLLSALHNATFLELNEEELLPAEFTRRGADALGAGLLGLFLFGLTYFAGWTVSDVLLGLAIIVSLGALAAWYYRKRETAELVMDVLFFAIYRIEATGPGMAQMPRRGPALILANHACWFDPIFLGKIVPRKIIPMMTSVFYDLPVMRWLMTHFGQAIRVEAASFRREVPELQEAIATLDRGDVLVIFPEGAMRRREDQWLRQFGQGFVHILRQRPDTPVFTCWIEGNWGSFFSYFNGSPTKNKRMDFLRDIRIALASPRRMEPELLEDHRAARQEMMRAVLETRAILGLEVPPMPNPVGRGEEVEV